MTRPPAFPARLLKRLVPAQDHEALLGDLCEEYQRRRSVVWYCVQILAAIVVGSWKDIRTHKRLVLSATVVGVVLQLLAIEATVRLRDLHTGGGFMLGARWIGLPWYWHWPYVSWSFAATVQAERLTSYMLVGWLVARLHRRHGWTMVLAYRGVFFALPILLSGALLLRRPELSASVHAWSLWLRGVALDSVPMLLGAYFATRSPEAA